MDNNFYNDNNNNDVKAENNQHNQDGFYSYKRPETANNPDYSAINNNASYIPPVLPKYSLQRNTFWSICSGVYSVPPDISHVSGL